MSDIEKIKDITTRVFETCYEHWKILNACGNRGAVKWSENESGAMVLYTRGEYKKAILKNVFELNHPRQDDIQLSDKHWVNTNKSLQSQLDQANAEIAELKEKLIFAESRLSEIKKNASSTILGPSEIDDWITIEHIHEIGANKGFAAQSEVADEYFDKYPERVEGEE